MNLRALLTRKNLWIASGLLALVIAALLYFGLRRPPRVPMERYVPATALAFIEMDNLADVVDGLTSTKAWRELAPALGLSSQLRHLGFISDLIGRTGLGPDEVVVAGRAQFALALTDVEAETGTSDDGPYIHFKPHLALLVETHAKPDTAARLVRDRALIIAQRIYGIGVSEAEQDYQGTQLLIFRGPNADRQLVVAASGTVIVLANHVEAMKACLNAIADRAASLADDATLQRMKPAIDHHAAVFAMMTPSGIEKLLALAPALIASRLSAEPESINSIAQLVEHFSKQAAAGFFYSAEFTAEGTTERYLTALQPGVAEGLAEPLKSAPGAGSPLLQLIPREIEDLTILDVERAGDLPERTLKSLAPHLDVVAAVALRESVINLRKQYGLEGAESVGDAVGNEIAFVSFGDGKPKTMLVSVKDRAKLQPTLTRYLARDGAAVKTESYNGTEMQVSVHEDGRAAAFVDNFLILGTREQIARCIAAQANNTSIAGDERFKQTLAQRPLSATIIAYRPEVKGAGELLLAVSKLTRVTDGSRELLRQDAMQKALDRLPRAVSFTEFRRYGVYTETRSAVGNFSLIASLVSNDDEMP
jgi:hypothetical protein